MKSEEGYVEFMYRELFLAKLTSAEIVVYTGTTRRSTVSQAVRRQTRFDHSVSDTNPKRK
jgi:hypothetical protein